VSTFNIGGDFVQANGPGGVGKVVNMSSPDAQPARQTADPLGRDRTSGLGRRIVLFLAASPGNLPPIRQDLEFRRIENERELSVNRDDFQLERAEAAQLGDIHRALARYRPAVVHFSGHGDAEGCIYVEDERGNGEPANVEGLAEFLALYRKTVRCVLVNACFSDRLAKALSRHIDYAIGMNSEIGANASIVFSVNFYRAFFGGDRVPAAFEAARRLMQSDQAVTGEYRTPVLYQAGGRG
jgi:hypothetical protein